MSYLALSTQAEVQFEALVREYSPFEGISAQAFESNRPTRILQEKHWWGVSAVHCGEEYPAPVSLKLPSLFLLFGVWRIILGASKASDLR